MLAATVRVIVHLSSILLFLIYVCTTHFVFVLSCLVVQGKAQASALGAQPNALLTVWNLQDLQSKGPVRYGDALFLQMGRHEVSITAKTSPLLHHFVDPPPHTHTLSTPSDSQPKYCTQASKDAFCSDLPRLISIIHPSHHNTRPGYVRVCEHNKLYSVVFDRRSVVLVWSRSETSCPRALRMRAIYIAIVLAGRQTYKITFSESPVAPSGALSCGCGCGGCGGYGGVG